MSPRTPPILRPQAILLSTRKSFLVSSATSSRPFCGLAQRLETSSKPEDRERAVNLKKAIAVAGEKEVDSEFEKLIALLKASRSSASRKSRRR